MSLTGIINLKACKSYKNKFEQGMINEFIVEAVDLGDLEKLRIGHDNAGGIQGQRRGDTLSTKSSTNNAKNQ